MKSVIIYKPVSPFRTIIKHFMSVHGVNENGKKVLINFIWKQRKIFRALKRRGGDFTFIFEVLDLIWGEEYDPWDYRLQPSAHLEEDFFSAKKFSKKRFVKIQVEELPLVLMKELQKLKKKLCITNNPFAKKGRLTATYDLEITYQNERYILTYSQIPSQDKTVGKPYLKGKKAAWQSNLSMYLLYRYFKRLGGMKVKDIEQAIADLVNGFSFILFHGAAEIYPDNVRKRIQWLNKQPVLVNKVLEVEKEFLTEDGLNWKG